MSVKQYIHDNKQHTLIQIKEGNKPLGFYNINKMCDYMLLLLDWGDKQIEKINGKVIYLRKD